MSELKIEDIVQMCHELDEAIELVREARRTVQKATQNIQQLRSRVASLEAENEQLRRLDKLEIARLHEELEAHRWIPVGERLPKKSGDYLTMIKYPHAIKPIPAVDMYSTQDRMWGSSHPHTHWKPIALPKEGK